MPTDDLSDISTKRTTTTFTDATSFWLSWLRGSSHNKQRRIPLHAQAFLSLLDSNIISHHRRLLFINTCHRILNLPALVKVGHILKIKTRINKFVIKLIGFIFILWECIYNVNWSVKLWYSEFGILRRKSVQYKYQSVTSLRWIWKSVSGAVSIATILRIYGGVFIRS